MNRRTAQDAIRLVTVILYFLFLTPGLLFSRKRDFDQGDAVLFLITAAVCILYVGIEVFEYVRSSYRYENPGLPRLLFLIRILLLILPIVLLPLISRTAGPVSDRYTRYALPGQTFMLLSLIPFYAHFAFPRGVGVGILAVSIALPVGFEIIVRDFSRWDANMLGFLTYRTLAILVFYVLAVLLDAERNRSDENRKLMKRLQTSESQLRQYAERVAHTVALEERTRLARDIHDSLGHALTAIKIQLSKAEAYHDVDAGESMSAVKAAKDTAEDAMKDIRESLGRLNGDGAAVSLKTTLPRLVERLEDAGLAVDYSYRGSEEGYNYSVLMGLYRFVQEGLTNILKHAEANRVSLTVELGASEAVIEILDDGAGFRTDDGDDEFGENRYGLKGLRRRLELVRGILEIDSQPGRGTRLRAKAPKDPVALIGEGEGP